LARVGLEHRLVVAVRVHDRFALELAEGKARRLVRQEFGQQVDLR
jgi:hypothetical protein